MNFYHLIQEKVFHTYEDWHMKSPIYDRSGFHITGIDNSLRAMRDGHIMYTEIRPPHEIGGCTLMKAAVGTHQDRVDLYLDIRGKKYCIADLHYEDAVRMMRNFVKDRRLPESGTYVEATGDDAEKRTASFAALAELLTGDAGYAKQFIGKADPEEIETAWMRLSEELLRRGRATALDAKSEKADFLSAVKQLTAGLPVAIHEDMLGETENIEQWCKALNDAWRGYVLAAQDVGSDNYVLIVLTEEDFARVKELAGTILHRIARAEDM
jgi:hypothetical protein